MDKSVIPVKIVLRKKDMARFCEIADWRYGGHDLGCIDKLTTEIIEASDVEGKPTTLGEVAVSILLRFGLFRKQCAGYLVSSCVKWYIGDRG